jgi:hypothetical protein
LPKTYKRYDQTDTRPFKSIYKEGYVTVDNYIAELFFQRRAEWNKSALPRQFWNTPQYKKQYTIQLIHINRLLERVSSSAILKAFKEVPSLSILNKNLVARAEAIQVELDKMVKTIIPTEEAELAKPTPSFGKPNRLTEL